MAVLIRNCKLMFLFIMITVSFINGCATKESTTAEESTAGNTDTIVSLSCDSECIAEWLSIHNSLRQNLNAGNLPNSGTPSIAVGDLAWDPYLAIIVQNHADACAFGYNTDRTTQYFALSGSSDSVGETIAALNTYDPEENFTKTDFFNLWADEEADFTYESFSSMTSSDYKNYSQLIWADTVKFACGYAICEDSGNYMHFIVCDYTPSGNYVGQYPYIQ